MTSSSFLFDTVAQAYAHTPFLLFSFASLGELSSADLLSSPPLASSQMFFSSPSNLFWNSNSISRSEPASASDSDTMNKSNFRSFDFYRKSYRIGYTSTSSHNYVPIGFKCESQSKSRCQSKTRFKQHSISEIECWISFRRRTSLLSETTPYRLNVMQAEAGIRGFLSMKARPQVSSIT